MDRKSTSMPFFRNPEPYLRSPKPYTLRPQTLQPKPQALRYGLEVYQAFMEPDRWTQKDTWSNRTSSEKTYAPPPPKKRATTERRDTKHRVQFRFEGSGLKACHQVDI